MLLHGVRGVYIKGGWGKKRQECRNLHDNVGEGEGGRNLPSHRDSFHDDHFIKHTHTHTGLRAEIQTNTPYKACHWELVEMFFCGAARSEDWSHPLHSQAPSLLTSDSHCSVFVLCVYIGTKATVLISSGSSSFLSIVSVSLYIFVLRLSPRYSLR